MSMSAQIFVVRIYLMNSPPLTPLGCLVVVLCNDYKVMAHTDEICKRFKNSVASGLVGFYFLLTLTLML